MGTLNGRQRLAPIEQISQPCFRPMKPGNPFVGSVEDRECDFCHLFEGLSILFQPRGFRVDAQELTSFALN
jgi:hypothetical protein